MAGSDIVERLRREAGADWHADLTRLFADAAEEIALLRAKVRHLSEPLPDDPGGRMWSTLNFLANLEGDDLETEVAHWASKTITHLRARVAELEAALEFYADPETYYGIGFLADSPCGEFAQDFSDDHGDDALPGLRPGARARRALGEESAPPPAGEEPR